MSSSPIYVPRGVIEFICHLHDRKALTNPCVCIKTEYKGIQVSISSDSSHGDGDLFRTDIRLFLSQEDNNGRDVTKELFPEEDMLYGDAETLIKVFKRIDDLREGKKPVGYCHVDGTRFMPLEVFEAWSKARATSEELKNWKPVNWS